MRNATKHLSQVVRGWFVRVGWLVVIWSLSVLALGAVALAMRGVMDLAGLKGG